jgi:hypothetical protein
MGQLSTFVPSLLDAFENRSPYVSKVKPLPLVCTALCYSLTHPHLIVKSKVSKERNNRCQLYTWVTQKHHIIRKSCTRNEFEKGLNYTF